MNVELAQLVSVGGCGRRNRCYQGNLSECLVPLEVAAAPQKYPVNWDIVMGLATALVVSAGGWIVVGIAVSHFLR